jgi:peptidyl-prolyl cis-trans isomerase A (cyclophilin A)
MKKAFIWFIALCVYFSVHGQSVLQGMIETEMGSIYFELYPQKAPATVANFLQYLSSNSYDQSSFFRVCTPANEADRSIPIQVIQGGNLSEDLLLPPITIETTEMTGIQHKKGTLSMARSEPNSAQSSFFICVTDQPELDFHGKRNPDGYGFAAFGQVTKGMDVVLKIQALDNKDQMLLRPVLIESIQLIK